MLIVFHDETGIDVIMYKHEYQGGPTVEILSCQGKDPLQKWKISNSNGTANLVYEKNVKGYAVQLEGSTVTSKMQLPKSNKQSLHLTQQYLVFQVYIPPAKDFSIELGMSDNSGSRRRILMSTSARDISITPLHAKLNISLVKRDTWLNLCFDLSSMLSDIFLKQTFKCLDLIVIAGHCKVRKIFTMRNQPPDTTGSECDSRESPDVSLPYFQLENVPPNLQFSSTVLYMTQVINVKKIRSELDRSTRRKTESNGGISSRTEKDCDSGRYSQGNQSVSRESSKLSSALRTDRKIKRPTSSGTEKSKASISASSRGIGVEPKYSRSVSDNTQNSASARPPFCLIQLVDEMEIHDSLDGNVKRGTPDSGAVFSFSSRPHVAHERPKSASNKGVDRNDSLEEDLNFTGLDHEELPSRSFQVQTLKTSDTAPTLTKNSLAVAPGITSLRDSEATLMSSAETLVHDSDRGFGNQSSQSKVGNASIQFEETADHTPQNVTISRKTVREIPLRSDLSRIGNGLAALQVDSWSESFEGRVLSEMKREQEEEDLLLDEEKNKANGTFNDEVDYNEESFDASWSTWKQPPGMDSEAYAAEMKSHMFPKSMQTLDLSLNTSDYENSGNLPSPPIVLPSERAKDDCYMSEAFGVSDGSTVSGQSASLNESDDEEMLDLMYDPCLNCYFDPKSGRYYELKG